MYITYFEIYLIIINIITFIVFGLDKLYAIKQRKRIRVVTLLSLSFIGGEIGGIIAMNLFHHKTKKYYFTIGMPVILLIHIAIFFYIKIYVL